MEVSVDRSGVCLAKVSVTVPKDEFEAEVTRNLRHVGKHTRLKGFRPGKVPTDVLERMHGENVRRETSEHFVRQAYQEAMEKEELRPAAHPRIEPDSLQRSPDEDLVLEFEVHLYPQFELSEYKGLELEGQNTAVADEELENAMEAVRRENARPEPVGEDGLPEDGLFIGKLELIHEGEVVHEREGLRMAPTSPPPGVDGEVFLKALVGITEGEERELDFTFPDGFPEHGGESGQCKVTVNQAFRMIPPTDEELYQHFSVEDEDGLRGAVRERMEAMKKGEEEARQEVALLQQIIDAHPMEISPVLVGEQVEAKLARQRLELAEAGIPPEEIDSQLEGSRGELTQQSEQALRGFYLVEAIAQKEQLLVTEEDMLAELASIAQRNGVELDEVKKYYGENNLFNQMGMELLEKKVRKFLREHASIRDAG